MAKADARRRRVPCAWAQAGAVGRGGGSRQEGDRRVPAGHSVTPFAACAQAALPPLALALGALLPRPPLPLPIDLPAGCHPLPAARHRPRVAALEETLGLEGPASPAS